MIRILPEEQVTTIRCLTPLGQAARPVALSESTHDGVLRALVIAAKFSSFMFERVVAVMKKQIDI